MTARIPLDDWQKTLPDVLPWHIRRNIASGPGGCWLWIRSKSHDGYGWASLKDKTYQAHRLVYRLICGEVNDGLVIDHLCRVRHCVNPSHMECVTPAENLLRSELTQSGMTRCKNGHEFGVIGGKVKQRRCIECRDAYIESRRENTRLRERKRRERIKQGASQC